jgi:toxin FitB
MTYLIDTNVVSEWRKTSPNPGVDAWASRVHREDLFMSVISIGEIRRGIALLQHRNNYVQATSIELWLGKLRRQFAGRVVPVSDEIAEEWGEIDASCKVAAPDALIAATAKVRGWTVVTRNVKDFEPTGVRVVNPFTE